MECATFGCETRGKTCMDEKLIRFRKQNLANSISYMHGICSLYLFSRTFLSGVIFFISSLGFPRFLKSVKCQDYCLTQSNFADTSFGAKLFT